MDSSKEVDIYENLRVLASSDNRFKDVVEDFKKEAQDGRGLPTEVVTHSHLYEAFTFYYTEKEHSYWSRVVLALKALNK